MNSTPNTQCEYPPARPRRDIGAPGAVGDAFSRSSDSGVLECLELPFSSRGAALGNTAKHSSHAKNQDESDRQDKALYERLELRKVHAQLVGAARRRAGKERPDRAELCMTAPLAKEQAFTLMHHVSSERNTVHGFQTCGNWACPYCAFAKARRHALELQVYFAAVKRAGRYLAVVTLTGQHFMHEAGQAVFEDVMKAKNGMFSGRWFQDWCTDYGIHGHVRHIENTYGVNGHHPHLHIVFETDQEPTDAWLARQEDILTNRWLGVLQRRGRGGLPGVAVKVTAGHDQIAAYLAKLGVLPKEKGASLSYELASAPTKKGRGDSSFSMFEVLRIAAGMEDARRFASLFTDGDLVAAVIEAGRVWVEYYEMIRGRQLVVWSNGLKKAYAVEDEADMLEREEEGKRLELGMIIEGWEQLRNPSVYVAIAAAGLDRRTLEQIFFEHGIRCVFHPMPRVYSPGEVVF